MLCMLVLYVISYYVTSRSTNHEDQSTSTQRIYTHFFEREGVMSDEGIFYFFYLQYIINNINFNFK